MDFYRINRGENSDIIRKSLAALRRYFYLTTEEINNLDDDTWADLYSQVQWILEQENPDEKKTVKYDNPVQERKTFINNILNKNE